MCRIFSYLPSRLKFEDNAGFNKFTSSYLFITNMPTITTTVTSAAASGVVTTQTTTEATAAPAALAPAPAPAPAPANAIVSPLKEKECQKSDTIRRRQDMRIAYASLQQRRINHTTLRCVRFTFYHPSTPLLFFLFFLLFFSLLSFSLF